MSDSTARINTPFSCQRIALLWERVHRGRRLPHSAMMDQEAVLRQPARLVYGRREEEFVDYCNVANFIPLFPTSLATASRIPRPRIPFFESILVQGLA